MALRPLLALAAIAAALLHAQEPLNPPQLQEDFSLFRKTLEAAHTGLYRYTSKAEMDARFDAAAKQLSRPMTALEFRLVIGPVLSYPLRPHTA
jgi:hypothetical protein